MFMLHCALPAEQSVTVPILKVLCGREPSYQANVNVALTVVTRRLLFSGQFICFTKMSVAQRRGPPTEGPTPPPWGPGPTAEGPGRRGRSHGLGPPPPPPWGPWAIRCGARGEGGGDTQILDKAPTY